MWFLLLENKTTLEGKLLYEANLEFKKKHILNYSASKILKQVNEIKFAFLMEPNVFIVINFKSDNQTHTFKEMEDSWLTSHRKAFH